MKSFKPWTSSSAPSRGPRPCISCRCCPRRAPARRCAARSRRSPRGAIRVTSPPSKIPTLWSKSNRPCDEKPTDADARRLPQDQHRGRSRGAEEQLECLYSDPRRRRAPAAPRAHGRRDAGQRAHRRRERAHRGRIAPLDRALAGAHQAAARDAAHAGHHADPGRAADHGREHLRRRGRHLGRAVPRRRTDRRRGYQSPDGLKVLIAGAGIGGLTAALALLKRRVDVEVYEQAAGLKEVGAGLQLSANGTRVLYALGIGEELKALSCEATGKEIRLWDSGETWKLFDLGRASVERYGYPYFTVYRPDLLEVLAAAVRREKRDAIHLDSKCTGLSQDASAVTLRLEKGEARGDALIGADGVHSRVRQELFGADQPQFTGIIAWRGLVPMDRLPAHMARMVGANWVGPGGHVVHYPLRAGKVMNFVGALERSDWQVESWSARGTTEELAGDFAGWHEDIHALIRNIPVPHKWALMTRPPMERWSVGHVTLLGDACHSMVPFLAQGAVMAIEDGYILGRCLEKYSPVPEALHHYEEARRERTRKAVEGSAANIGRFHHPALADPARARDYVAHEWPGQNVADRYEWLFRYDVTSAAV